MPVPTSGLSLTSVGTAWRCMLEPIRARLASSCSRNRISAAPPKPPAWATRPCNQPARRHDGKFVHVTHGDQVIDKRMFLSRVADAWAMTSRLVDGGQNSISSVTLPFHNLAVGLSEEAVLVGAGVGGQRVDQADVRAFRRLDGTDPAVVGG